MGFVGGVLSVVNALSEKLDLEIYRNGSLYEIKFSNGATVSPLIEKSKNQKKTGTKLTFGRLVKSFLKPVTILIF